MEPNPATKVVVQNIRVQPIGNHLAFSRISLPDEMRLAHLFLEKSKWVSEDWNGLTLKELLMVRLLDYNSCGSSDIAIFHLVPEKMAVCSPDQIKQLVDEKDRAVFFRLSTYSSCLNQPLSAISSQVPVDNQRCVKQRLNLAVKIVDFVCGKFEFFKKNLERDRAYIMKHQALSAQEIRYHEIISRFEKRLRRSRALMNELISFHSQRHTAIALIFADTVSTYLDFSNSYFNFFQTYFEKLNAYIKSAKESDVAALLQNTPSFREILEDIMQKSRGYLKNNKCLQQFLRSMKQLNGFDDQNWMVKLHERNLLPSASVEWMTSWVESIGAQLGCEGVVISEQEIDQALSSFATSDEFQTSLSAGLASSQRDSISSRHVKLACADLKARIENFRRSEVLPTCKEDWHLLYRSYDQAMLRLVVEDLANKNPYSDTREETVSDDKVLSRKSEIAKHYPQVLFRDNSCYLNASTDEIVEKLRTHGVSIAEENLELTVVIYKKTISFLLNGFLHSVDKFISDDDRNKFFEDISDYLVYLCNELPTISYTINNPPNREWSSFDKEIKDLEEQGNSSSVMSNEEKSRIMRKLASAQSNLTELNQLAGEMNKLKDKLNTCLQVYEEKKSKEKRLRFTIIDNLDELSKTNFTTVFDQLFQMMPSRGKSSQMVQENRRDLEQYEELYGKILQLCRNQQLLITEVSEKLQKISTHHLHTQLRDNPVFRNNF